MRLGMELDSVNNYLGNINLNWPDKPFPSNYTLRAFSLNSKNRNSKNQF